MDKNQAIGELLSRTVSEIIDRKHLEEALQSGKKLRVKLGIDPTSPDLHIGRAVALWKLRQFQDLGHQVIFIVGDFTGLVGDTSDKDSERPMLTEAQVKANMKTYLEQALKILDPKKTETHYNSEWLKKLGFIEIAKMANLFGLHEFESREVISRRMKIGKRVSFHELMYPLMQGYDSVAVNADVELGGTDQRFNLLAGRTIQPSYGQKPQDIVMMDLLEGTDGRKMSSSWGNVINLTDEPNDMFGKIMSINDDLIIKYFEYATRVPMEEVKTLEKELKAGANPRDIKKRLAQEIVTLYHGAKAAKSASAEWEKVFSNKEKPSTIPSKKISPGSYKPSDLIVAAGLVSSKSEARRLIAQGGVKFADGIVKNDNTLWEIRGDDNLIIQVGKRKFVKIK
jgi:tyrosyl-tRNA synthetase